MIGDALARKYAKNRLEDLQVPRALAWPADGGPPNCRPHANAFDARDLQSVPITPR